MLSLMGRHCKKLLFITSVISNAYIFKFCDPWSDRRFFSWFCFQLLLMIEMSRVKERIVARVLFPSTSSDIKDNNVIAKTFNKNTTISQSGEKVEYFKSIVYFPERPTILFMANALGCSMQQEFIDMAIMCNTFKLNFVLCLHTPNINNQSHIPTLYKSTEYLDAVHADLNKQGIKDQDIILFGDCIGSNNVIQKAASNNNFQGVIAAPPNTSLSDITSLHMNFCNLLSPRFYNYFLFHGSDINVKRYVEQNEALRRKLLFCKSQYDTLVRGDTFGHIKLNENIPPESKVVTCEIFGDEAKRWITGGHNLLYAKKGRFRVCYALCLKYGIEIPQTEEIQELIEYYGSIIVEGKEKTVGYELYEKLSSKEYITLRTQEEKNGEEYYRFPNLLLSLD